MLNQNILIVDDELDILNLIVTVLEKEGFRNIYRADSGKKALEIFSKHKIDLIVLDIMLGDMEGYDLCKEIRKNSLVPILFLSAKDEELDKILGFTIGGDDYITKPFSPKELAYRIKAHLRRREYEGSELDKDIINRGAFYIDKNKGLVKKNGREIDLKPKELKMLIYFLENDKYIKTKEQIYENVWEEVALGDIDSISNTIMVQIRNLRKKIEDNPSSPSYILTVKGLGYKFDSGD